MFGRSPKIPLGSDPWTRSELSFDLGASHLSKCAFPAAASHLVRKQDKSVRLAADPPEPCKGYMTVHVTLHVANTPDMARHVCMQRYHNHT